MTTSAMCEFRACVLYTFNFSEALRRNAYANPRTLALATKHGTKLERVTTHVRNAKDTGWPRPHWLQLQL